MFSKACEYGIKATIYIATQSLEGNRVKIDEVAKKSDSPEAFTAKVLGKLTKHKIVNSYKGPNGGFEVDLDKIKDIKVKDIVYAIDGDEVYNNCALGLKKCGDENPCPIHDSFIKIRVELKNVLTRTSIHELAVGLRSGKSTLLT